MWIAIIILSVLLILAIATIVYIRKNSYYFTKGEAETIKRGINTIYNKAIISRRERDEIIRVIKLKLKE